MRWHGRRVTVYAYTQPTDMRKGFDGPSALVTQGLARDPLNGEVYILVSRDRVGAKVLHWDGTGLCIYAKRLERSQSILARIWTWATEQVGLPHSDFGKAVRYRLARWTGLTALSRTHASRSTITPPNEPCAGRSSVARIYGSRSRRGDSSRKLPRLPDHQR